MQSNDYSHHIIAYLIHRCIRAGVVPALRMEAP
jgi:hypothetical protein